MKTDKNVSLLLTIFSIVIGLAGLIMSIMIMIGYNNNSMVGPTLDFSYWLFGIAAGFAILFGVVSLFANLKKNIPFLIGIAVLVVIGFICYSAASGEVLPSYGNDITESASKFSGAGLYFMYVMVGVAVVVTILGEIIRLFN